MGQAAKKKNRKANEKYQQQNRMRRRLFEDDESCRFRHFQNEGTADTAFWQSLMLFRTRKVKLMKDIKKKFVS